MKKILNLINDFRFLYLFIVIFMMARPAYSIPTSIKELKKSIIACGLPYQRQGEYYQKLGDKLIDLEREIQSVRKLGVAALSMAYIAAGRLEGYIVSGAHPWDMAGGLIILEEAGGKITNYQGEPYTLDTKEWMATNGHLHDILVDMYK